MKTLRSVCLALVFALGLSGCATSTPLLRQASAMNSRGARQLAQHDYDGAEASFQIALEYNDRFAEPHNNLGLVALAREHIQQARRHFRAAIARNADFAEAWSNLGVALLRRDGEQDTEYSASDAAQAFRHALSINPGLIEARVNLVRSLLAAHNPTEALTHARRLTQTTPERALAHTLRAEAALETGALGEAEIAATTALRLDPSEHDATFVSARVLVARERPQEALPLLATLLEDERLATDARALRAVIFLAAGAIEDARSELARLPPSANTHPVVALAQRTLAQHPAPARSTTPQRTPNTNSRLQARLRREVGSLAP